MAGIGLRALIALRRLRHAETDAARRDLGTAVARQTALTARDEAITREFDRSREASDDFDRETYSAWLRRMRNERSRLADAMLAAASRTAEARTCLARCRVAETSADDALARAVMEREAAAARREQVMLEDAARAIRRADHGNGSS